MSTRRARILSAGLLTIAFVLAVAGCSGSGTTTNTGGATGGTTGAGATMVEKAFQFSPADLTVKVGDTVTFDNQDTVPHHVIVGTTDLGEQAPGESVTWTADADGTYPVKCSIHPSMTGRITVGTGGAGGTSAPGGNTGASTSSTTGY